MGMDEMFGWKAKSPQIAHRSVERSGAFDGGLAAQTQGLMAGTRVASNLGWRSVEALAVGDTVLTFDHGMQQIIEIRRRVVWIDAAQGGTGLPVVVPAGALDNRTELTLLPDQGVLVDCDAAQDMYGDPFAVVPASALEGVRGIHRAAPFQEIEIIAIYFARDEVIYAEGGTLVHCPATTIALDQFLAADAATYDLLGTSDAAFIAECLMREDQILASVGRVSGAAAAYC